MISILGALNLNVQGTYFNENMLHKLDRDRRENGVSDIFFVLMKSFGGWG